MSIIAMGSGGGLNNTKLRLADAAVDDVLKGRKFYSGDKTLKTGTLELTGTASSDDVLSGVTFYNTNAKSKQIGTLELTGNAYADDVLMGRTFYNTDAKTKVTGTLALTGTAYASDVLYGETFYNTNAKTKITGTMPNRGAVSEAIYPGGSYTIPAGYHNGSGSVTAKRSYTTVYLGQQTDYYTDFTYDVKSRYGSIYDKLSRSNFYTVPYAWSGNCIDQAASESGDLADYVSYDSNTGMLTVGTQAYGRAGIFLSRVMFKVYMIY